MLLLYGISTLVDIESSDGVALEGQLREHARCRWRCRCRGRCCCRPCRWIKIMRLYFGSGDKTLRVLLVVMGCSFCSNSEQARVCYVSWWMLVDVFGVVFRRRCCPEVDTLASLE